MIKTYHDHLTSEKRHNVKYHQSKHKELTFSMEMVPADAGRENL